MRRFWVITAIAVAILALWMLAEEGRLGRLSTLGERADRPQPSWGDVAGKVGEFAEEERALQEAIDGQSETTAESPEQ